MRKNLEQPASAPSEELDFRTDAEAERDMERKEKSGEKLDVREKILQKTRNDAAAERIKGLEEDHDELVKPYRG